MKAAHTKRGLSLRLGVAAVLTAVIGMSAWFAGSAAARARPAQAKPTIVLVHGAWADGSSWGQVVPELQREGYTVFVEANPLRGLTSDAAYLAAVLHSISGPIVLVGHSYGGAVITNGAVGDANVKALVYVDAFVPDQGENVLELANAKPGSCLGGNPTSNFNFVAYPGALDGDVDLYVKPSLFPSCFANGLPSSEANQLAAAQRPLTLSAGMAPSGVPAWKTIPSWALVGTKDHVIPPAELTFMARRAHAHVVKVPAPHLSMLAKPAAVTDLIVRAARATS
jgi:pimeloyl-ACP methyl ester carboxylesterase